MKIFKLETFDDPQDLSDEYEIDVKIFDLDDTCGTGCDVRIYVPGPAGPAGISRPIKTGLIAGSSFSGSPKKSAVVFTTPYDDTNYGIALSGTDSRNYTYELKTAIGFTINANASAVIAGEVSWTTMTTGETS